MLIDFGWTADGAAWADARGGNAQGRVRMGPRALVRLMQTRLGLTRPSVDQAERIAQYMTLIRRHLTGVPDAAAFWPARSFEVDPWSTSRQLLRWRDAAIEAGWVAPDAEQSLPPRLSALRDVELSVVVGMPGTVDASGRPATLAPSAADDLAEVVALLEEHHRTGGSWPLGVETIAADDYPTALPGLWPRLFTALARSGAEVTAPLGSPPEAERTPRLEVVSCQDEWTAADVGARYLAAPAAGDEGPLIVLAGSDTAVLDQALHRRGLPAVGNVAPSTDRAHHQLLGLFLDVATSPVDVHQLAALLDLRVLPWADGDAEPIGLVPATTRRHLLRALTEQPGVGGPAWQDALQSLAERAATGEDDHRAGAEKALAAARAIDALVSDPLPADSLYPQAVAERLEWLAARLRTVSRGQSVLLDSLSQVQSLQAVLGLLDEDIALSRRTLQQIIDACGGSGHSPLAGAEVSPWRVTTRAAHVAAPGGTVLWWAPEGDETPTPVQWDTAEQHALCVGGAHLVSPEQLSAIHLRAALRGLSTAARVIAVLPGRRMETAPTPSGLLAHLESAARIGEDERRSPESLVTGRTWSLGGRDRQVHMPPLATVHPAPLTRRALDATAHLLPDRLSFTSAQTLVGCPLHWLLQYALDVRPSSVVALPTGDRMIGTLVHAVVEQLVHDRWDADVDGISLTPPTDAEITAALDRLIPQYASELDLPGNAARRAEVHARTLRSLRTLFTRTADAGLRISGTEVRFERPLTLQLAAGQHTVDFVGYRDMDLRDAAGHPMVIDLKWSRSRTRYGDLYDTGDAVQLASYTWSLDQSDTPADAAEVGYFLLHSGEFISADHELDPRRRDRMDVGDSWDRLVRSVTDSLDAITAGSATAGCRAMLEDAELSPDADHAKLTKALSNARDAARAEGRVLIDSYCRTSEYAQLCGLTGDFR